MGRRPQTGGLERVNVNAAPALYRAIDAERAGQTPDDATLTEIGVAIGCNPACPPWASRGRTKDDALRALHWAVREALRSQEKGIRIGNYYWIKGADGRKEVDVVPVDRCTPEELLHIVHARAFGILDPDPKIGKRDPGDAMDLPPAEEDATPHDERQPWVAATCSPEAACEQSEEAEILEYLMRGLTDEQRDVLDRHLSGAARRVIAGDLHVPDSTVQGRLRDAKKRVARSAAGLERRHSGPWWIARQTRVDPLERFPWPPDKELIKLIRPMTPDEAADLAAGHLRSTYARREHRSAAARLSTLHGTAWAEHPAPERRWQGLDGARRMGEVRAARIAALGTGPVYIRRLMERGEHEAGGSLGVEVSDEGPLSPIAALDRIDALRRERPRKRRRGDPIVTYAIVREILAQPTAEQGNTRAPMMRSARRRSEPGTRRTRPEPDRRQPLRFAVHG